MATVRPGRWLITTAIVGVIVAGCGGSSHMQDALERHEDTLDPLFTMTSAEDFFNDAVTDACAQFEETATDNDVKILRLSLMLGIWQEISGGAEATIEQLAEEDSAVDAASDVVRAGRHELYGGARLRGLLRRHVLE